MYENMTADRRECILSVRRKPKQDMIHQNSMHEPFGGYQPQPIPPSQPSVLHMDLPPPGIFRASHNFNFKLHVSSFKFDDSTPTDQELQRVKVDSAGAAPMRDMT
ncbi:uncharacterized protein EDB91DRAFT_1084127 [Suillus paluster]|uniref:uncharacterized protein n=1 Tax=Suillus paluster TaxID=48578 RepID=UPI001B86F971|nr:uncharacterized protein EDB91DRAFT_1084127 [Suillus paluster]KAG1734219.1 hypothetical protein EDB91DRAFT_1084127 [Suillus paluster]